ncbi:MAG: SGNH/GDSL hydrolase family protein [Asticcacaulis sp.]
MGLFQFTRRNALAGTMAAFLAFGINAPVHAAPKPVPETAAKADQPRWVKVWSPALMIPGGENVIAPADVANTTLRQTVRLEKGGKVLRIHLSNAFGREPLKLSDVHIALATATGASSLVSGTDRALTFGGLSDVSIPAGANYISDPVSLDVPDNSSLSISFYMNAAVNLNTGHPGARGGSWLASGNHSSETDLTDAKRTDRWYVISGVEVETDKPLHSVVVVGDSITDGYGIVPNSDHRWTNYLANHLKDLPVAVLNAGIGGGRILQDGLGPNAMARFDRDVLTPTGVKYVIVLEGVNDLGVLTREAPATPEAHADMVAQIKLAFLQMIQKAHSHGLKIYGATITPYGGNDYYHPEAASEADRQAINSWIRESGAFDAVIDFDALLRDPAKPDQLLPAYDSGDHLHPSDAGYSAMGAAVDLKLFSE